MTFKSFGATRPIASNVPVTLKDKDGNPLTHTLEKSGAWRIEASRETFGSPEANGFSIYATPTWKNISVAGFFRP